MKRVDDGRAAVDRTTTREDASVLGHLVALVAGRLAVGGIHVWLRSRSGYCSRSPIPEGAARSFPTGEAPSTEWASPWIPRVHIHRPGFLPADRRARFIEVSLIVVVVVMMSADRAQHHPQRPERHRHLRYQTRPRPCRRPLTQTRSSRASQAPHRPVPPPRTTSGPPPRPSPRRPTRDDR